MKYVQEQDGVWSEPVRRGYREMCCDCGLTHIMDFRLVISGKNGEAADDEPVPWSEGRGYAIQVRHRRDQRATAAARKGKSQQLRDALKKEHE